MRVLNVHRDEPMWRLRRYLPRRRRQSARLAPQCLDPNRIVSSLHPKHRRRLVTLTDSMQIRLDRVQRDSRVHHWVRVCVHQGAEEHALARHVLVPLHERACCCDRRGFRLSVVRVLGWLVSDRLLPEQRWLPILCSYGTTRPSPSWQGPLGSSFGSPFANLTRKKTRLITCPRDILSSRKRMQFLRRSDVNWSLCCYSGEVMHVGKSQR